MLSTSQTTGPGTHLYRQHQLRVANAAAADAAWEKQCADNPKFVAVLPQLDELAGFYNRAVQA